MDSLQSKVLCQYLVKKKISSDHQLGFLPCLSTTTQLVYRLDKRIKSLGKNGAMAVFMDFRKAFSKVWHSGLLYKLAACGVQASSLAWLKDYFSDSCISMRVNQKLVLHEDPMSVQCFTCVTVVH